LGSPPEHAYPSFAIGLVLMCGSIMGCEHAIEAATKEWYVEPAPFCSPCAHLGNLERRSALNQKFSFVESTPNIVFTVDGHELTLTL
jgi:hypothetical protein